MVRIRSEGSTYSDGRRRVQSLRWDPTLAAVITSDGWLAGAQRSALHACASCLANAHSTGTLGNSRQAVKSKLMKIFNFCNALTKSNLSLLGFNYKDTLM